MADCSVEFIIDNGGIMEAGDVTGSGIIVNIQAVGFTFKIDSYKQSSVILAVYSFVVVLCVFTNG